MVGVKRLEGIVGVIISDWVMILLKSFGKCLLLGEIQEVFLEGRIRSCVSGVNNAKGEKIWKN